MIFPLLLALATFATGTHGEVRCATPDQWAADPIVKRLGPQTRAYTTFTGTRYTVLRPDVCGALVVLTLDPQGTATANGPTFRDQEAAALLTLTHEAAHLAGVDDEGQAECQGVEALRRAARWLGASQKAVQDLYARAWRYHLTKPAPYRTVC